MERQTLLFRGNAQFHKSGAIKIPRDIDSDNYLRLKMIPKLFQINENIQDIQKQKSNIGTGAYKSTEENQEDRRITPK